MVCIFFFFKQKTAYEMRISDWSSDVCSSDLWKDPAARDAMYQGRMPGMCGTLGLKDQVRWAASGNWALVAGGDTEKDVAALEQVADALGFEPHAVPCQ